MKARTLFILALIALLFRPANAGQVTGTFATPGGSFIQNGTITFTLSQLAVKTDATQTVAPMAGTCYTSTDGSVVGLPNPLALPSMSATTGTMTSGVYYEVITYWNASGEAIASPEQTIVLSSSQGIQTAGPALQPTNGSGYNIYIGITSGGEVLQAHVTGFASTSIGSLVGGASPPVSNSSTCSLAFNDTFIPAYTTYQMTFTDSTGSPIAGYPQSYYFQGSTVNLNTMLPASGLSARFPQPIVASPTNTSTQSINSNLSLNGHNLLGVGSATFGGGSPWYDVTSSIFGAKCDGVTDDRIPIQATIAAAELFGGNVFIPDGKTCVVATNSSPALNLDQALNVSILCGVAGGKSRPGGGLTNVCQLKFTGTPAVALSARSSFGVVINGVALTASNAAFSGTIIDTSHVSIQDTQNFGLLNSTVTGTSTSCSIGVSLDKAIDSNVTNSHFFGCTAQVKGASASGSYSNNNKIRDNDFNGGTGVAAFIRNPGKTTDISANTFELNTGANLIDFSGSFADCGGTSVEKNLINDLSGTPTFTMISVPCSAFSVNKNNFQIIDANATAIAVSDNVANFSAKGNAFCAGTFATLFALGTADVVDIREDACSFTVTNFLTGTPAAGSQVVDNTAKTTNYGAVALPTSLQVGAGTTFAGSVGTGTRIASNSAVQTFVQACSGTATAGTTLALQWAGGACTSSATALQAPTSTAGTLLNLRVKCGTGGVNASSGVFTLEKNGANATVLTCTMGTGTACADTTHSVAAAAGDTWQVFFTTQGAETLANCAASWEKQ